MALNPNPDDYPTIVSDSDWGQVRSKAIYPPGGGAPLIRYAWFPHRSRGDDPKPPADAGTVPK